MSDSSTASDVVTIYGPHIDISHDLIASEETLCWKEPWEIKEQKAYFRETKKVHKKLTGVYEKAKKQRLTIVASHLEDDDVSSGTHPKHPSPLALANNLAITAEKFAKAKASTFDLCLDRRSLLRLRNKAQRFWDSNDFWKQLKVAEGSADLSSYRRGLGEVSQKVMECLTMLNSIPPRAVVKQCELRIHTGPQSADNPKAEGIEVLLRRMCLTFNAYGYTEYPDVSLLPYRHSKTSTNARTGESSVQASRTSLAKFDGGTRFTESMQQKTVSHYKTIADNMRARVEGLQYLPDQFEDFGTSLRHKDESSSLATQTSTGGSLQPGASLPDAAGFSLDVYSLEQLHRMIPQVEEGAELVSSL